MSISTSIQGGMFLYAFLFVTIHMANMILQ